MTRADTLGVHLRQETGQDGGKLSAESASESVVFGKEFLASIRRLNSFGHRPAVSNSSFIMVAESRILTAQV